MTHGVEPVTHIFPDLESTSRAVARAIAQAAADAIDDAGRFSLAISGGATPHRLLSLLAEGAEGDVDWSVTDVFWADERCVPPDHEESNYRWAAQLLLEPAGVPPASVHRMRGEAPPDEAAAEYDRELARYFGAAHPEPAGRDRAGTFDLVVLGVGDDGHTASLFPGSPVFSSEAWAAAVEAPPTSPIHDRITLTLGAIDSARRALFLASRASKADIIGRVLASYGPDALLPAARVRPRERLEWFIAEG